MQRDRTLGRQAMGQFGGDLSEAEDSDNEERSSSVASHTSNVSYSVGDHQVQASHTRGAITASEFNISSGRNPRESWLASEQDHDREGSYVHHTAAQRSSRRMSRGSEFPAAQQQQQQDQPTNQPSRDRASKLQQHIQPSAGGTSPQRLTHEPGSLSDTGAASLSDKEAASMGTPLSRSERRARVRDQQQSSNERSIGDGGGSSQSLRSQSGGQTSGGGLSKKSNSTTQLSLSGKLIVHDVA